MENQNYEYEINNLIARSLADHFECVYLVDIETGHYIVFVDSESVSNSVYPEFGEDFFADAKKNAGLFIHPDDLEFMVKNYKKDDMLLNLSKNSRAIT